MAYVCHFICLPFFIVYANLLKQATLAKNASDEHDGAPLRALARPAGPQPKFYLGSNPS
jgi:hypothetical protein